MPRKAAKAAKATKATPSVALSSDDLAEALKGIIDIKKEYKTAEELQTALSGVLKKYKEDKEDKYENILLGIDELLKINPTFLRDNLKFVSKGRKIKNVSERKTFIYYLINNIKYST
jgi:hypothetical protein